MFGSSNKTWNEKASRQSETETHPRNKKITNRKQQPRTVKATHKENIDKEQQKRTHNKTTTTKTNTQDNYN